MATDYIGWTSIQPLEDGDDVALKFDNAFANINVALNNFNAIVTEDYVYMIPQVDESNLPVVDGTSNVKEGTLYYDAIDHSFVGKDDIIGTKTNLGKELVERAFNPSGVDIPEGIPVRVQDGGMTSAALHVEAANAVALETATLFGYTTSVIPAGGVGKVVTTGRANGVNTKGILVNNAVFLDDAVGEVAATPPEIITIVGYVVKESTSDGLGGWNNDGIIYVRPRSIIALPNVVSFMKGALLPLTVLAATPTRFESYVSEDGVIMSGNVGTGEITASANGIYDSIVNIDLSIDPLGQTLFDIIVKVWEDNGGVKTVVASSDIEVPANGTIVARSFTETFRCFKDAKYYVEITSTDEIDILESRKTDFTLKSIDIR